MSKKQIADNQAKIDSYLSRVDKLTEKRRDLNERLAALIAGRKAALVEGVNIDSLTKEINHITGQIGLQTEETEGLLSAITTLQQKIEAIKAEMQAEAQREIDSRCVAIAREVNTKMLALGGALQEYNSLVNQSTGKNAGHKLYVAGRFGGCFVEPELPKIYIRGEFEPVHPEHATDGSIRSNFFYK